MPDQGSNGWSEYRRLILSELERLNTSSDNIRNTDVPGIKAEIADLRTELRTHKAKVTAWASAAAALITIVINVILALVKG